MNRMNSVDSTGRHGGALAALAMIAGAALGLASQPAAAASVQLAQLVCDSSGCGAGAGRATPPQGPLPRPYYGGQNAEEKRALQERDRMRRERRERGEAGQR